MRRFILGFLIGALLAMAVTVYASDQVGASMQDLLNAIQSILQRLDKLEERIESLGKPNGTSASATTSNPVSPSGTWTSSETEYYTLRYQTGFEGDAAKMGSFLDWAIESLLSEFHSFDLDDTLRTINVTVQLDPQPSQRVNAGRSLSQSGTRTGGRISSFYANIFLLSPSAHSINCCTSLGERFDDSYFLKVTIHEYAGIVLDIIGRLKTEGWRFRQAPSWYVQGYEEYLAITLGNEHSRTVTTDHYKQRLRQNPHSIRVANGEFHVANPYSDGVMILTFLHDVFGKERVHELIRSPLSFDQAFARIFNSDGSFENQWQEWLAQL